MSLETFGTGTPGAESSESCSLRSLIALGCRARAEAFARKLQDKLWTLGQSPAEHDDPNQSLSSAATSDCQLHHHFAKDVHASYQTSWTVAETVNGDTVVTTVPFTKSRSKEELYPVVCSCCTATSMEHDKLQDPIQNYTAASSTQYRIALAHALAAENRLRDSDQYFDFGIETPPEPIDESEALLDRGKSLLVLNAEDGLPSQPESGCVFSSPAASSDSDEEDPAKEEEAEESGDTSFYDVESLSQSPATPFLGTFASILENQVAKTELPQERLEDPINGSLVDLLHSLEQLTPTITPIPDDSASTTAEPTCCANSSASTLSNSPTHFRESPLGQEALSGIHVLHLSDADNEPIKSAVDQGTGREDVLMSLVMYTSSVGVAESTEEFASPLVPLTGLHVLRSLSSCLGPEEKDDEAPEQLAALRPTHPCEANAELGPREREPRVDVISLSEVLLRGDPKGEADVAHSQCTRLSSCADDVVGVDGVLALACCAVSSSAYDHGVELHSDREPEDPGQHANPDTTITTEDSKENEPADVHCVMNEFTMAVGENDGECQPCFVACKEAEAAVLDCLIKTTNIHAVNGECGLGQMKSRSSESESSGYTTESIPPSSDSDADSEDLTCVVDKDVKKKNNAATTDQEQRCTHLSYDLQKLALSAQESVQECENLETSRDVAPALCEGDDDEITVVYTESDSDSAFETGKEASSLSEITETAAGNESDDGKSSSCNQTAEPAESEPAEFDSDVEDEEDIPAIRRRVQRSTSLKTGKTPPGTPGRKKIVRFADALGLDLAAIRTFMDEVPQVPKSAYRDLSGVDDEYVDPDLKADSSSVPGRQASLGRSQSAPVSITFARRSLPLTTASFVPNRSLMAGFTQPGSLPSFLELVKTNRVSLENAVMVEDMTIRGVVRVLNIDFHKSVIVRYTTDEWRTSTDTMGSYITNSCDGLSDRFSFHIYIPTVQPGQRLVFAVCYRVAGQEFWDNNSSHNYIFQCISTCPPSAASTLFLPSPSDPWMPYL